MYIVNGNDRINGAYLQVVLEGRKRTIHHYIRFIGQHTELWIFGAGIGEYTLAQQLGDSFLTLIDKEEDPHLGRIMLSLGYNPASLRPYRGDINIVWSYGIVPNELESKLGDFIGVAPNVVLSPHKALRERAIELGREAYHMHSGVGRFFYPMGLERTTIGFAGLDNKTKEQRHIVLGPAIDRGDLDWRTKNTKDVYVPISELNEFYNTLKVTFGMVPEERQNINYMPSRIFETLAAQTPIITYKLYEFRESMGFDYPYQTTSYEETKEMMEYILDSHEEVMKEIKWYSDYVREHHCYEKKLTQLFKELKRNGHG